MAMALGWLARGMATAAGDTRTECLEIGGPLPAPGGWRHIVSAPTTGWADVDARARAIARAAPFVGWPGTTTRMLAHSARVVRYPRNAFVFTHGHTIDRLYLLVEGAWEAGVTAPNGRRTVFRLDGPGRLYGLLPLVDGLPIPNDLRVVEPATVLELSFQAVRAELDRNPKLWAEVARETAARARSNAAIVYGFAFDSLQARAAHLLLGLAKAAGTGPAAAVEIGVRLSQQLLGEMLGVSRQTATALVRDLGRDGLVRWRYGRVTLLDVPRLRALAADAVGA